MIKFKSKVDGSVFVAEPKSILYRVLKQDSNFEEVEEKKEEVKKEEKPKKKATK